MTITAIENMNEKELREAFAPDFECNDVKGFQVYLVDLGEWFGFSMVVFGNGRQIIWANDYELHHKNMTRDQLRDLYFEKAEAVLFTIEELESPLKSYFDFEARRKFIMELLPLKADFMSMFYYAANDEERAARKLVEAAHPLYCAPAMGFFAEGCEEHAQLVEALYAQLLEQEKDVANNYKYQKSAFYYELGNHEYHINTYQGDWDTLSAFGQIPWRGQGKEAREKYFADLGFTEIQKKAFEDARMEFLKAAAENDWY